MNKVILLGFLSQEPTTKEFPEKNLVMTRFSIAASDLRNYNQSYFFNCVAWNQIADYVGSNLHKGDFVSIDGRLTNRSFVNETGMKTYITEIIVDNIKNLGSKKTTNENTTKELDLNTKNQDMVDVDQLIKDSSTKNDDEIYINKNHDDHQNDNEDNDDDNDNDEIDWDL